MKLEACCRSEIGTREKNEDYAAKKVGVFTGAFVVCDGVGGSPAGEIASRGAAETLLKCWGKSPSLSVDSIATAFEETNRVMREIGREDREVCGMRTTAAALFYRFGYVRSAHVGDSRVYLFRKGRVYRKTKDHIGPRAELLRALGGEDQYLPELSEKIRVRRGDAFLICSDGFWGWVSDAEMESALNCAKSPEDWVEKLLAIHNAKKGEVCDNYTVFTGFFR